jgi:hypothetical protein
MNDEEVAERIDSAAEYFEREEYVLADRARDVRAALTAGFATAILCSQLFTPQSGTAGGIVLLLAGAAVWLYGRWRRSALEKIDGHIWIFWCKQLNWEQIVTLRKRVQELRSARSPVRHQHPSLPLGRHLEALRASTKG